MEGHNLSTIYRINGKAGNCSELAGVYNHAPPVPSTWCFGVPEDIGSGHVGTGKTGIPGNRYAYILVAEEALHAAKLH